MREIPLSLGLVAFVDDEDYEELNRFQWCAYKGLHTYYASRKIPRPGGGSQIHIMMHREILGLTDPKIKADHRDGNGLNNQRENLRRSTTAQNCANSRKSVGTRSRFKGACFHVQRKRWYAYIRNGEVHFLGSFSTEEEAARAYDRAALERFGEFAKLNFPRRPEPPPAFLNPKRGVPSRRWPVRKERLTCEL